jgi:peptidyl-prolyl cis-trans isomerase D
MSSKSNIFTKTLTGLLVLLMIAGVAVWGVNDILIGSGSKTIAKVGNIKISDYELDNMVQNNKMQLSKSGMANISEDIIAILKNNALVNIIADKLLQNEFARLNLQLDDKEVLKQDYLSQPDFDKDKLKSIAYSMGGEAAFLHKISKDKKTDFLQGSLTASKPVTNSLAEGIYNFENQTRDIEYLELGINIINNAQNPSEAELKDFYEKNKDNFISPEYRVISYIVLDKSILKDGGSDATTQLHDISSQILDKVAGGQTLEEVAKEYSLEIKKLRPIDSSGNLESGAQATGLPAVKDFIPAVFATEQGEISDLLESDNGDTYAFVKVDEINDRRIKSFDEVKTLVTEGIKTQKRAEKLIEITKSLKSELDSGKQTLEDFAAKNVVAVKQKNNIGFQNRDYSPEFTADIFNTPVGKYTNLNRSTNGSIIIAKVTHINSSEKPDQLTLYKYKAKIQEQISQEIMAQYLDYLKKEKYNVSVYLK